MYFNYYIPKLTYTAYTVYTWYIQGYDDQIYYHNENIMLILKFTTNGGWIRVNKLLKVDFTSNTSV